MSHMNTLYIYIQIMHGSLKSKPLSCYFTHFTVETKHGYRESCNTVQSTISYTTRPCCN